MIRSISVANLGPFHGEQSAVLGEGLISIEGRYTDSAKAGESNRAGKTAFIDLIQFGLFGKVRHSTQVKYINRKANARNDPVYVSLEIENPDGQLYHIVREFNYRTQAFTLKVPESEETLNMKQLELQNFIEQHLIGCDYDTAVKTWLVLQGKAQGIMSLTTPERKKFLLDVFAPNQFPWEAYYTEAVKRHSVCATRLSELTSRIATLQTRLAEINGQDFVTKMAETRRRLVDIQAKLAVTTANLQAVENEVSPEALENLRRNLATKKHELADSYNGLMASRRLLDRLRKNYETYKAKQETLTALRDQKKKVDAKVARLHLNELNAEYEALYRKHQEAAAKLSVSVQHYRSTESFSGVCPVTHEDCPNGANISQFKQQLEDEIAQATQEVDALQQSLDKLSVALDAGEAVQRDAELINSNIEATEMALNNLADAGSLWSEQKAKTQQDEESYNNFKATVSALETEVEAKATSNDVNYQRRIRELKQQKQILDEQANECDNILRVLVADEQRQKLLQQDLADAQREQKVLAVREKALKALKPMLSTSGVPFHHSMASVSDFEKEINRALADLGTELLIEVEPYMTMTTLAPICEQCGYEYPANSRVTVCPVATCQAPRAHKRKETLDIKMRGSLFDVEYDEDSGGGQQWVAMGIRFALFNLFRNRGMMGNVDFWSLDEVFAPLSDYGKTKMLQFLEQTCLTYNIRQLFLITHTDISNNIMPSVVIERDDALQESRIITSH